jgi:hypothetical protein
VGVIRLEDPAPMQSEEEVLEQEETPEEQSATFFPPIV